MKEEALFIINSPFQALCAFEAISHYNIKYPVFYVFDCDDSRSKIAKLLNNNSISEIELIPFVGTKELFKVIRTKPHFNNIFIGDFFSYNQYLIGVLLSKRNSQIVYLDDGTATLDLLPSVNRKRYEGISLRSFAYRCLNMLRFIKGTKESLFSFFDIKGKVPYEIEENTFSFLKANCNDDERRGVYIIGTNSSVIPFKGKPYPELLKSLVGSIRKQNPRETIYYCPHRRDTNHYDDLLKSLHIDLFQTEISVEVDFVTKKINPSRIVGFASTALITLKKLFPQSKVQSIRFEIDDLFIESSIRSIEEYYNNHDIKITDL